MSYTVLLASMALVAGTAALLAIQFAEAERRRKSLRRVAIDRLYRRVR